MSARWVMPEALRYHVALLSLLLLVESPSYAGLKPPVLAWSRTVSLGQAHGTAMDGVGNLYVVGKNPYQSWLVRKYGSSGTLLWERGVLTYYDAARDAALDSAGNLIVVGTTTVIGEGANWLIQKYTPDGVLLWSRSYNGVSSERDSASCVAVDPLDNLIVGGCETRNDLSQATNWLLRKYDAAGNLIWSTAYDGPTSGYDEVSDIAVAGNGDVVGLATRIQGTRSTTSG